MSPGEELRKLLVEVGGVARLREWPPMTGKGEGDRVRAMCFTFLSDEGRMELCTLWKEGGKERESQASLFFYFFIFDLCRFRILL